MLYFHQEITWYKVRQIIFKATNTLPSTTSISLHDLIIKRYQTTIIIFFSQKDVRKWRLVDFPITCLQYVVLFHNQCRQVTVEKQGERKRKILNDQSSLQWAIFQRAKKECIFIYDVHQIPKKLPILRKGDFRLKLDRAKSYSVVLLNSSVLCEHCNIDYQNLFKLYIGLNKIIENRKMLKYSIWLG